MSVEDEIAGRNERHWEKMVEEKCGFTIPWLDLRVEDIHAYIHGDPNPSGVLLEIYPSSILADVKGKNVLCLASGGGQQSAVFGLLGAQVTVLDLTEGQLAGDRTAAAHYGYRLTAIKGDMRDLSTLRSGSFDLVYQAPAIGYVPDVRPVYSEVYRVLKKGGAYRVEFTNPATQFVDPDSWDGEGYRITVPYSVRRIEQDGREATDFRHYLSDIFNGLINEGFVVAEVHEAPAHLKMNGQTFPGGSWDHWLSHVQSLFAIVGNKI
jgi:SAM-dependent methyltransferase